MLEKIKNALLFRGMRFKRLKKKLIQNIETEISEEFLKILLSAMRLFFILNKKFRKNIKNFNARYLFKTIDNKVAIAAVFKNSEMDILKKNIQNTNVIINFKNSRVLKNYLSNPNADILGSVLRQDVIINGNLSYMYKFAYMARHLQLMLTNKL